MSTQPEALRLADALEKYDICAGNDVMPDLDVVAAELRRLFELAHDQHTTIYGLRLSVMNLQKESQEQLNALHWIADRCPLMLMEQPLHDIHKEMAHDAGACARAAIDEAGEQK